MEHELKAVLFDLDGTLLPMDQDGFTSGYFKFLVKKLMPHGYEPSSLIAAVWHGTKAMVENDGSRTNEEAFWEDFSSQLGEKALRDRALFEEFYAHDFARAQQLCGFDPRANAVVSMLRAAGVRTVLATNPVFPAAATEQRVHWAGLEPSDFELVTTYENIGYCKPNLDYYREILRRTGLPAENCIMVGNDVGEDMCAARLGMGVFLLTDHMLNRKNEEISKIPQGGFDELIAFLKAAVSADRAANS